ncbi:MAG: rod-binding protein [Lachnospiraceae bacterium]|nr:rod-binding protein [Lachnospiraceae bacterium]
MSVSIDNYAGSLADLYGTTNTGGASNIEQSLSNKDFKGATDEELMDVCKQFEAYFIEQLYKGMEAMIPKDKHEKSSASKSVDLFKDSMIQQIANDTVETQGLGIAQMLFESMKRDYGV